MKFSYLLRRIKKSYSMEAKDTTMALCYLLEGTVAGHERCEDCPELQYIFIAWSEFCVVPSKIRSVPLGILLGFRRNIISVSA